MKKEINNSFENVEKRASKLPSECTTIIVGEEQRQMAPNTFAVPATSMR